ncbi:YhcN/YlaJ family sporulation lipoprotein [Aneurinibacillus terranovensis]|uniref:YhcN/YlaJ family sporulation lipoprotein n=1 Tax=Aneurinibacillus terranovensis TaxID=278991 RepID=UPI001FE1E818|nr:YhcN/YlaJ family sporulation lipoprotein [Aneurinibacillus terranovensis]
MLTLKWICLLLLIFSLTACNLGNKSSSQGASPGKKAQTQKVQQTAPQQPKPQDPQTTANRLASLATKIPNVKRATAIVYGKIAIVGIDVPADLDRSRVGTIKYSVAEALKDDPQGARALVTADADIVQRIREMNADIRRGRPLAGFAEELADIAGRIVPQMPKDTRSKQLRPENGR